MSGAAPICLDASAVVRLLLPGGSGSTFARVWAGAVEARRVFVAPHLLGFELTNALHRLQRVGLLEAEELDDVLDAVDALGIQPQVPPSLHRRAAGVARSLDHAAAYDAHYLVVAQRLGAELWTADRRLYASAERLGVEVRLVI